MAVGAVWQSDDVYLEAQMQNIDQSLNHW